MNKWQKEYCKNYCKGKEPKKGDMKDDFDMLGQIKDEVTVTIPTDNGYPDIIKTYKVVGGESGNMLMDELDIIDLLNNLYFWFDKGYDVETA